MADKPSVEERLASLERELAELKTQVKLSDSEKENWITDMKGQFVNDPAFEEIARLGKEIRDKEQPDYGVGESE